MLLQKQLTEDDCYRTAIACLLNLAPEDVPHFYEDAPEGEDRWGFAEAANQALFDWLTERGLVMVTVPLQASSFEEFLEGAGKITNKALYYMASGRTAQKRNHVVICWGNEVVWNTGRGEIVEPLAEGVYLLEILTTPIN